MNWKLRRILHCIGITKNGEKYTEKIPMQKWDKKLAEDHCRDVLAKQKLNSVTAFYVVYLPFCRYGISDVNKRFYVNAANLTFSTGE